jgi:inositol-phosphate phosphatase / L-galactose 1-phosphate phosphatase
VNMAHVASGVLDACYEDGYGGPWDVAAGHVLVTEAGGVVRTPEGGPFTLFLGEGALHPLA